MKLTTPSNAKVTCVEVYFWSPIRLHGMHMDFTFDVKNSVWIRKQLDVTFVLSFISPLQVAQHVSGNHVTIFRS